MTPADKEIVAEYMGWSFDDDANLYFYTNKELDLCIAHYDLNDAGLCVEKMVENIIDWNSFLFEIAKQNEGKTWSKIIATVFMNADNFFTAMAEWLRQK